MPLRRNIVFAAMVTGAMSVFAASPANKPPWDWTIEERIAERANAQLAAQRIASYTQPKTRSLSANASAAQQPSLRDVINGSRNPELFLPHELFDSLVRRGYVGETWRDTETPRLVAMGLGSDFWERLEDIASIYITDYRRVAEMREGVRNGSPAERRAIEAAIDGMHQRLCRERADALRRAEIEFGPALLKYLYSSIAAERVDYFDAIASADHLRAETGGCQ